MLGQQLAQYLENLAVSGFDYRPTVVGGNVFIDHMPDQPDGAVAVMVGGGREPMDAGYGYDRPRVQFIVRGAATGAGRLAAHTLASAIRAALAGATSLTLPDVGDGTTLVVGITAEFSGPVPLGTDEVGRPEYSSTLEVEVVAPTGHRPLG